LSRLTDKFKQAGGIVGRQTRKIEDRLDALIASETQLEGAANKSFTPHEAWIMDQMNQLDELGKEMALLNNNAPLDDTKPGSSPGMVSGGPPLPSFLTEPKPAQTFAPMHPLPTDKDGKIIG